MSIRITDFLSDGGKLWPRAKGTAGSVGLLDHVRQVLAATRTHGIQTFFVPHHCTVAENDYTTWKHLSPSQRSILEHQTFAKDSWAGTFHPDFQPLPNEIVIREHWGSSAPRHGRRGAVSEGGLPPGTMIGRG